MLRNAEGSDFSVQGTNDEAQVSKLSCANLGYYKDDFIKYFVRKHTRRSPLINRGYFSRYSAISKLLHQFLQESGAAGQQPQVLCLGAGFDTRWFQLASDNGKPLYKCLELDFVEVTQRKAAIIKKEPSLFNLVNNSENPAAVDLNHGEIVSKYYTLKPVDLRKTENIDKAIEKAGFDLSAPTFVLSECVLVYLEPECGRAVIGHLAKTFRNAAIAIYEQVKPDDAFGRQMVSNLELRGCPLKGLPAVPTLQAHCGRLSDGGWSRVACKDMDVLYRTFVDKAEQERIEKLEVFDEFEEWHLIQEHYCIALGVNDADGWLGGLGFDAAS